MKRTIDINEVSDGKLYEVNDMIKAGCDGCRNCHACCVDMGGSIILDPLDIYNMTNELSVTFEQLLAEHIELNVVDGIILPNIKMNGNTDRCRFLNEEGRCSIHSARPGICRLFPLGRIYEERSFKYFLQVHECPKENKSKVKIKNWLGIENINAYEKFVNRWHYLLADIQDKVLKDTDEQTAKNISMYILQNFYIAKYSLEYDIYDQLNARLDKAEKLFGLS
jgi:Fe-S-cluster containining protein